MSRIKSFSSQKKHGILSFLLCSIFNYKPRNNETALSVKWKFGHKSNISTFQTKTKEGNYVWMEEWNIPFTYFTLKKNQKKTQNSWDIEKCIDKNQIGDNENENKAGTNKKMNKRNSFRNKFKNTKHKFLSKKEKDNKAFTSFDEIVNKLGKTEEPSDLNQIKTNKNLILRIYQQSLENKKKKQYSKLFKKKNKLADQNNKGTFKNDQTQSTEKLSLSNEIVASVGYSFCPNIDSMGESSVIILPLYAITDKKNNKPKKTPFIVLVCRADHKENILNVDPLMINTLILDQLHKIQNEKDNNEKIIQFNLTQIVTKRKKIHYPTPLVFFNSANIKKPKKKKQKKETSKKNNKPNKKKKKKKKKKQTKKERKKETKREKKGQTKEQKKKERKGQINKQTKGQTKEQSKKETKNNKRKKQRDQTNKQTKGQAKEKEKERNKERKKETKGQTKEQKKKQKKKQNQKKKEKKESSNSQLSDKEHKEITNEKVKQKKVDKKKKKKHIKRKQQKKQNLMAKDQNNKISLDLEKRPSRRISVVWKKWYHRDSIYDPMDKSYLQHSKRNQEKTMKEKEEINSISRWNNQKLKSETLLFRMETQAQLPKDNEGEENGAQRSNKPRKNELFGELEDIAKSEDSINEFDLFDKKYLAVNTDSDTEPNSDSSASNNSNPIQLTVQNANPKTPVDPERINTKSNLKNELTIGSQDIQSTFGSSSGKNSDFSSEEITSNSPNLSENDSGTDTEIIDDSKTDTGTDTEIDNGSSTSNENENNNDNDNENDTENESCDTEDKQFLVNNDQRQTLNSKKYYIEKQNSILLAQKLELTTIKNLVDLTPYIQSIKWLIKNILKTFEGFYSNSLPIGACIILKTFEHLNIFNSQLEDSDQYQLRENFLSNIIQEIDLLIQNHKNKVSTLYWLVSNLITLMKLIDHNYHHKTTNVFKINMIEPTNNYSIQNRNKKLENLQKETQKEHNSLVNFRNQLDELFLTCFELIWKNFKNKTEPYLISTFLENTESVSQRIQRKRTISVSTSSYLYSIFLKMTVLSEKNKIPSLFPTLLSKPLLKYFGRHLFNTLLSQTKYCTYHNGVKIKLALTQFETFLKKNDLSTYFPCLNIVQQASDCLIMNKIIENKSPSEYLSIFQNIAPDLTYPQIFKLLSNFQTDKMDNKAIKKRSLNKFLKVIKNDQNYKIHTQTLELQTKFPYCFEFGFEKVKIEGWNSITCPKTLKNNQNYLFLF
ncbi:major sperm protein [Anaeramoeba flamelloides]|uniref:Major sperm protein n=1 Tax=Anaeramoeba flamelloides TaxID=1746091 RepID=A0AAV7ZY40_9EUKA|nr:major sperm protein [Anaeramoeba flamelloides]